ncbi:hypothetical protein BG000_003549 [Podila horticola]|nr:hypothetical protein BG000_003549 [Podila horticola]
MTGSLMVFNTAEPGPVVHVPYLPNEPVFYIVDRISAILAEDHTQIGGCKLFVNGGPIHDMSNGEGTNIEGLCDCHKGNHRVICEQGFGITEMTTVKFECPLCHRSRVTSVTVGFAECKFRVHGIKMCGDQCTTDWTTVTREDCYALFDPAKHANWRRLMIESVSLDGAANGERCLMRMEPMQQPMELDCGHHYHSKCSQQWNECLTCLHNKDLPSGTWS